VDGWGREEEEIPPGGVAANLNLSAAAAAAAAAATAAATAVAATATATIDHRGPKLLRPACPQHSTSYYQLLDRAIASVVTLASANSFKLTENGRVNRTRETRTLLRKCLPCVATLGAAPARWNSDGKRACLKLALSVQYTLHLLTATVFVFPAAYLFKLSENATVHRK